MNGSVPKPDLLDAVQKKVGLRTRKQALLVSAAVLAPLCARLSYTFSVRFLGALPPDLARLIAIQIPSAVVYETFDRYVSQVTDLDGSKAQVAIDRVAAVMSALDATIAAEVIAGIAAEVPKLFIRLFPEHGELVPTMPPSPLQSSRPLPLWSTPPSGPLRYIDRFPPGI